MLQFLEGTGRNTFFVEKLEFLEKVFSVEEQLSGFPRRRFVEQNANRLHHQHHRHWRLSVCSNLFKVVGVQGLKHRLRPFEERMELRVRVRLEAQFVDEDFELFERAFAFQSGVELGTVGTQANVSFAFQLFEGRNRSLELFFRFITLTNHTLIT